MNARLTKSGPPIVVTVGEEDQVAKNQGEEVLRSCHQILERHARSFSLASRLLRQRVRDRAAITYAFCRLVDDAVDEAKSAESAQAALVDIEAMLVEENKSTSVVGAYVALCQSTGVGLGPAGDLILGARSDLHDVRTQSDKELITYCYRVAGTVGLMMCGVLNVKEKQAQRYAIDLGIAMQLTNICRDVLEDAEMGRVYLPADRLERQRVWSSELILLAKKPHLVSLGVRRGVAAVVEELLELGDSYYESAKRGFQHIPVWPRLSIIFASKLYREIGEELRRRGGDAMLGRVHVSGWRKSALFVQSTAIWLSGVFRRRQDLFLPKDASHHAAEPLFK